MQVVKLETRMTVLCLCGVCGHVFFVAPYRSPCSQQNTAARARRRACIAARAGGARGGAGLATAAAGVVVGRGVGRLQAEVLVEPVDEGVEVGVGALVDDALGLDGERRVGDAQLAGPGGAAAEAERQQGRRRGPGSHGRRRRRRRRRRLPARGCGGALLRGAHHLERARHLGEVEPVAAPGGAAAAAAPADHPAEGEQGAAGPRVRVGRRGGAAELHVPGVGLERHVRGGGCGRRRRRRPGAASAGGYLEVVVRGGGSVVVVVVVRGGDEVAERPAGELAPAEQQVEVQHEALAAESPAQHVVDGAEHAHEALPEPGGLHAAAAAAGRRPDPLVGLLDCEIRGAWLGE